MLGFKKFIIKALCFLGIGFIIIATSLIFRNDDQTLHSALVVVSFFLGGIWANLSDFINKAHDEVKKELNKQS